MPAAIGAAAVKAVAGFTLSKFLASAAISLAMNAVAGALFGKPKPSGGSERQPRKELIRASAEPHRVIYGRDKVSGVLAFATTTGSEKQWLHLIVILAAHECDAIETIYLGDRVVPARDGSGNVTTGKFKDHVNIGVHLGATDQVADPYMVSVVSAWTAAHRLRGLCYIRVSLKYDRDIFPNGIPTPSAIVRGKKVYDPRTDVTAYSTNAALCIRDYIQAEYGVGALDDEINEDMFVAAANICDETIDIGTETQKRYTLNGSFTLDEGRLETLDDMLTSCAGALIYSQGQYGIRVGAYREPALDIGPDDIISGPVVTPRMPRADLFNVARGTFFDRSKGFQENDIPEQANLVYIDQDGERIPRDMSLRFTDNSVEAQRILKIHLEKSRQAINVKLTVNFIGLQLQVFDNIRLTIPQLGWANKVFTVLSFRFGAEKGIDLELQEEAAAVYNWDYGAATIYDPAPNTDLPDPFTVPAPLTLSASSVSVLTTTGDFTWKIVLAWAAAADAMVTAGGQYEVQYKRSDQIAYQPSFVVDGSLTSVDINQLQYGISYDVRVRAINSLGVKSSWTALSGYVVGSGTGGVGATLDYGEFSEAVVVSLDYGEFSDSGSATLDYGDFV
jgi:hypothetical protein